MNDVPYVTQDMWDRAQAALRAALPIIEQHTPPLSTAGTMVSLRDQVRNAINGCVSEPPPFPVRSRRAMQTDESYVMNNLHTAVFLLDQHTRSE